MNSFIKKYNGYWVGRKANGEYLQERVFLTLEHLFQKILKLEFRGRVLDLGCGDGSFVNVCKKRGIEAAGVDIKDGINFEIDRLPYKENYFDIIVLNSVIEHLYNPSNILQEIRRALRPAGTIVIISPNLKYAKQGFYDDAGHVKPYTARGLEQLMKIFGFPKIFIGLWTVKKSHIIWKLPENLQFIYGAFLPFSGLNKYAPKFLKGKSKTMLCCFKNSKER